MAEPLISRQYRATLFKYRKFKQRLDKRLKNNTLAELSLHHRNRLLRTIERLRRQLAVLQERSRQTALSGRTTAAAIAMGAALAISTPALAQVPDPVGTEFRVNSYTFNAQEGNAIATDSDGNFVVAWSSTSQDGNFQGIYAQRYNALGQPDGSEFLVNTTTTWAQQFPSIAMDDDGDFVIVWQGYGGLEDNGVFAQRYNAVGQPQGTEFQVNTHTTDTQYEPVIAMDADGDFVVAWTSLLQDGSYGGIYAQRYNAIGVAQGIEFRVNSFTTGGQLEPSIAMDSDGDFVIVWRDGEQEGNYGIYAQRYNASGIPQGGEFRANTHTTSTQSFADVAMDDAGDFVITWHSNSQDGSYYGIYAQRYNPSGVLQGAEFRVNTITTGTQFNPGVAMDVGGEFVITWVGPGGIVTAQRFNSAGELIGGEFVASAPVTNDKNTPDIAMDADGDFAIAWASDGQDGSGNGIYARRFTVRSPVNTVGGEFGVNAYTTSWQNRPSVATDEDGDFVITWMSYQQDGDSYGIYAQRYNEQGIAQGPEFKVSTYTTGQQLTPVVAMDADGDFVIVWRDGSGHDGDGYGIFAQRYDAAGVAQGGEFQVNSYTTGSQTEPSVAMDVDGDFVVVYASAGIIRMQRYNASGVAQDGEFFVNSHTATVKNAPSVAMDADGGFVVSWNSDSQDGSGSGVYAKLFDAAGNQITSEFRVNSHTTNGQSDSSVGMDANGDFIVAWTSEDQDGDSQGIYAQRFNSEAVPQGVEFLVNTQITGGQRLPSVDMGTEGDFVIAWSSMDDGSDFGVFAQRYNTEGLVVGAEFRLNTYTTNSQSSSSIAIGPGWRLHCSMVQRRTG